MNTRTGSATCSCATCRKASAQRLSRKPSDASPRRKESPDGEPWAEWSDVHAATRHAGQSLLQGEGDLLDSIQYEISGGEIRIGSPLVYAGVMQDGAKRGEFGQSSRGPIPWGDIPGREYLGLSIENEDDLLDMVEDYIEHEVMPL